MKNNIEKRLTNIEQIVEHHLIESGEIRTDLLWLKRAFWTLAGAGLTMVGIVSVAILSYLLKR